MKKYSRIKENILTIGIAVILVLFVGYGIHAFYESPDRDDFCTEEYKNIQDREECEQQGGKWIDYQSENLARIPKPIDENISGWCNQYYVCEEEYENAREVYTRNVFIVSLVAGLIAIILGGVVLSLESVSSGIMGGGLLTVIYGTVRYWGDMSKYLRVIILGLVLIVLIWIGYKKFKK